MLIFFRHLPLPFLAIVISLISNVSAHGFLRSVQVNDGDTSVCPQPSSTRSDTPSAIRQVSSQDPNYGTDNPAIACGPNAFRASQSLNAMPGDVLHFDWTVHDLNKWPHDYGPMITYLADCGSTPCSEFDTNDARWFKIHQAGKRGSGRWVQEDLFRDQTTPVTLPSNLAAGNYIVRHEIIALHIAEERRRAEFYPGCVQITVGGSGTGRPTRAELVSFPGGYTDDDEGIFIRDVSVVYGDGEYAFPGPPIAILAAASDDEGSGRPTPSSSPSSPSPSPSSTRVTSSIPDYTPTGTTTAAGATPTGAEEPGESVEGSGSNGGAGSGKSSAGKCVLKKKVKLEQPGVYRRHARKVLRRLIGFGMKY